VDDYLKSLLLGVVEGLTEFLPVSSTAHLRLCEHVLGIDLESPYWKMYSVVIQLGAILAVLVYFWRRILAFAATFPSGRRGDRTILNHPLSLTLFAFVLTAIPSFLLRKAIDQHLESVILLAGALIVGGLLMWIIDVVCRHPRTLDMEEMSAAQAAWIGLAQTLSAVFPGLSRSMVTIATGQLTGMSRSSALEFSFFLSLPTMIAATGFKLVQGVAHAAATQPAAADEPSLADPHGWIVLGIGFSVSFVVALGVIAWFMQWVRKHGFLPFAVYRIAVGAAVLLLIKNP